MDSPAPEDQDGWIRALAALLDADEADPAEVALTDGFPEAVEVDPAPIPLIEPLTPTT
jgi:hypothetical protein